MARFGSFESSEHLQPLEIACGTPLGPRRPRPLSPPRSPELRMPGAARRRLEELILELLDGGALSVSFSGGRDSSLILAIATTVARREGFPDPLPVTVRHHSEGSREDEHQEAVLRHLGLTDWERVDVGNSMDVLGDDATRVLLRHGPLAPPNAYLHLPIIAAARGGALLTGHGGDQVLGTPSWRIAQVLARRVRPRPRDLALLSFAAMPSLARRRVVERRRQSTLPWLTPVAAKELSVRRAADWVLARMRWDVQAVTWAVARGQRLTSRSLDLVADGRILVRNPLADPRFVEAFAAEVGIAGPPSRDHAMRMLGADLLPESTLTRRSKANFDEMLLGERFRSFVDQWDVQTLNPSVADLVDVDVLREHWCTGEAHYASLLLLQRAWLDQVAADS